MQAMNTQVGVIDEITIQPPLNLHPEDLVPGRKGVDFPESVLHPNVTVTFSRVGRFFFVQVPPESQSNVRQISVDFFNAQQQLVATYTSLPDVPRLADKIEVDGIVKIVVHFDATTDGKSPKNVTMDVIGCFFEGNWSLTIQS